jgi:hypothetical protein
MTAQEIKDILKNSYAFRSYSLFVPEYTWKSLRVDALIVDIGRRWIRGFEIKISRADFIKDDKWTLYSEFCSSLSVVCPEELIQPEEINKPFGLLWVVKNGHGYHLSWKRKPTNFQRRNSLSWFWTYTHVLETEIIRLDREASYLRQSRNRG